MNFFNNLYILILIDLYLKIYLLKIEKELLKNI